MSRCRPGARAEHWASCSHHRRKAHESDPRSNVVIDGLHSSAMEVGFVPEACASRILQELLPPLPMGIGTRPLHQRIQIAPVLAHAGMHGEQRKKKILVAQEAIGLRLYGGRYLRPESKQGLDSVESIHSHSKVNHDQVGIFREIDGLTFHSRRHIYTSLVQDYTGVAVFRDGLKNGKVVTFTFVFNRIASMVISICSAVPGFEYAVSRLASAIIFFSVGDQLVVVAFPTCLSPE